MPNPFQDQPWFEKLKKFFTKERLNSWALGFNITFSVIKKLVVYGIAFLLLIGSLAFGIGTGYFAALVADTTPPTKEKLKKEINDFDEVSKIVYSDGSNIASISTDLVRYSIPSKDISPYLKKAIVATEDEYFNKHHGIVPKALTRAIISDATGFGGSSGGSTLTQQLVKQQILTSETTFKRKANEILLALRVDKYFSKDEIITAYLNVSPFGRNNKGENIAGVEAAARGIFGTTAKNLTLAQAAFIAGLPQSPIVYSPYLNTGALKEDVTYGLKRKDFVLFSMLRNKVITQKEYEEAKKVDLKKQFIPQGTRKKEEHGFLYYSVHKEALECLMEKNIKADKEDKDKVFKDSDLYSQYYEQAQRELQRNGYIVETTIDKNVQTALNQGAADYGYLLDDGRGPYVENGGILMDNHSGRIYGFIAGRDFSKSQNNHAFSTKRPPGSTIKPVLVYGPALDIGLIGTETKLSNFKTHYKSDDSVEIQNNGVPADNTFHTALNALTNSLNIPTYHLYQALMEETDPADYMKKMHYDVAASQFHHESSPFGQMDMTVLDQTKGFATLANGGVYHDGYLIQSIKDTEGNIIYKQEDKGTQVYSKAAASILNKMMRNVIQYGTGTTAKDTLQSINYTLGKADWIGKTGTTSDNKDFWFIASTPGITFSSWIGYDDGTSMISSNSKANQRYWSYVINRAYQANAEIFEVQKTFELDKSVKEVKVSDFTGEKKAIFEYHDKKYQTPGKEITSYFAKGSGEDSSYEFGIGGTKDNYKQTWQGRLISAPKNAEIGPLKDDDKKEKQTSDADENDDGSVTQEDLDALLEDE